jgi:hypothetical protein
MINVLTGKVFNYNIGNLQIKQTTLNHLSFEVWQIKIEGNYLTFGDRFESTHKECFIN